MATPYRPPYGGRTQCQISRLILLDIDLNTHRTEGGGQTEMLSDRPANNNDNENNGRRGHALELLRGKNVVTPRTINDNGARTIER